MGARKNQSSALLRAEAEKPRTLLLLIWIATSSPFTAPSIAGDGGGKARMSERRDARVRAGPRAPRSAGHHARAARVVRCRGRRLFGYFFFAGEEKVTRARDARGKGKGRALDTRMRCFVWHPCRLDYMPLSRHAFGLFAEAPAFAVQLALE